MVRRADEAIARIDAQLDRTQLTFDIEPPGAEVRVDRREMGQAPIDNLKVTPGPHQITVWAEGYEGADVSVDVRPGAEVPVGVSLAPLVAGGEARAVLGGVPLLVAVAALVGEEEGAGHGAVLLVLDPVVRELRLRALGVEAVAAEHLVRLGRGGHFKCFESF